MRTLWTIVCLTALSSLWGCQDDAPRVVLCTEPCNDQYSAGAEVCRQRYQHDDAGSRRCFATLDRQETECKRQRCDWQWHDQSGGRR